MIRSDLKRVGITTTVPLEPFLASGITAVDLNNSFISHSDPASLVENSQVKGYPRNICTWIKGLHSASDLVDGVVGVVRGDCSNTESLLETLKRDGKPVQPFSYPLSRTEKEMEKEIEGLCQFLGCDIDSAGERYERTRELRDLALAVDEIGWREGTIPQEDVHASLVSSSDLGGDPDLWERRLTSLIENKNEGIIEGPRLAYIGVPPIITDIFSRISSLDARVVFFETQRQFAMPARTGDWIRDYLEYTYPYDISGRVEDIGREIERRDVDGIIHYVQSFCHRQIDDVIFRKEFDLPLMTLEGNLPGPMDGRNMIRLESFLDVVEEER